MSVSPVLGTVVGGILAALLAVVGALVGVNLANPEQKGESDETRASDPSPSFQRLKSQINVAPLACVILSIVAGAVGGVYGRTHQWLALDPQAFINRWQSVGLTHEEALQLLIRESYGPNVATPAKQEPGQKPAKQEPDQKEEGDYGADSPKTLSPELSPVLFATVSPKECQTYKNLYGHGEELVRALATSSDERVRSLTKHLWETSKNPQMIELVTKDLICAPEPPQPAH
jgi:hypothetical protein